VNHVFDHISELCFCKKHVLPVGSMSFFSLENMIKFHCHNQSGSIALLLVAAFTKPGGKLYKWSWALIEHWPTTRA